MKLPMEQGIKAYFSDKQRKFNLYNGDFFDVIKKVKDNSIDMIFADPPYNLSNGGFSVHAGKRVSVNKGSWDKSNGIEKDFEFHYNWIEACKRVLKPNGTIWISGTYHSIYQCGFALQKLHYHILNDVAWFKPNAAPNLSCRFFTASHETLIWARKDKAGKHTFNYQAMKKGKLPAEDIFKVSDKQMRSVWSIGEISIVDIGEDTSVWPIGTPKSDEKKFGKHPTQKPIDLLRRIVIASSKKGDWILDPFAGSSTTGLAAYEAGRNFIGIDMEKEYLDLSIKRFKDINNKLRI